MRHTMPVKPLVSFNAHVGLLLCGDAIPVSLDVDPESVASG